MNSASIMEFSPLYTRRLSGSYSSRNSFVDDALEQLEFNINDISRASSPASVISVSARSEGGYSCLTEFAEVEFICLTTFVKVAQLFHSICWGCSAVLESYIRLNLAIWENLLLLASFYWSCSAVWLNLLKLFSCLTAFAEVAFSSLTLFAEVI